MNTEAASICSVWTMAKQGGELPRSCWAGDGETDFGAELLEWWLAARPTANHSSRHFRAIHKPHRLLQQVTQRQQQGTTAGTARGIA